MKNPSAEKVGFALSAAFVVWVWGFLTSTQRWFPNDLLVDAKDQGAAVWERIRGVPPDSDPVVYRKTGARSLARDSAGGGPTAVASNWKDLGWEPALRILGEDGRVLHQWRTDPTEIFPEFGNPLAALRGYDPPFARQIYDDGDIVAGMANGLVRLGPCGEVRWTVSEPTFHHIGERDDEGTFWHPARRIERVEYPGIDGAPVQHDLIIRVAEEDGEVLNEISVLEILYQNDLEELIFKVNSGNLGAGGDLTHLNKVAPLRRSMASEYPLFEAGDLLVSLRELHLVFVFDPDTGRVKWSTSDSLIRQHDPEFIGDGWIGVFDNHWDGTRRGTALGGSRIVAYQPYTDSMKVLFPGDVADDAPGFYTQTSGAWQLLDDGNLLITESRAGRVFEVTPEGQTVWEWVNEYGKGLVPEVYGGRRVKFTADQIASWPCSTGQSVESRHQARGEATSG